MVDRFQRTLKTTVRAGNLFGNQWEPWKALEQYLKTVRCTLGSPLWLHLAGGGTGSGGWRERDQGQRGQEEGDGTAGEGTGTRDTPLGYLTGCMCTWPRLCSPREKKRPMGQGLGQDRRRGSLPSMPIPAAGTDLSVRQRTPGWGGLGFRTGRGAQPCFLPIECQRGLLGW